MTLQSDDYDPPLVQVTGYAEALVYPDDIAFYTDEERDRWRAELRDREQRRRPAGFAPWPAEQPQQHLRIA